MKKLSLFMLPLMICVLLSACANPKDDPWEISDWVWEYKVDITCPWGKGGGADTTLQAFSEAFEKISGTEVVIEHKSGSGGIAGMQYAQTKPSDGALDG